jgi:hypothetical protein
MLKFQLPIQTTLLNGIMNNTIVTLPVENIQLSVNYYQEYLGFQLISNNANSNIISNALLVLDDQKIKLEQVVQSKNKLPDNVVLEFNWNDSQLKQHFDELRQKVKVKRSYSNDKEGYSIFSIMDCDGNTLIYQSKKSNFINVEKNI